MSGRNGSGRFPRGRGDRNAKDGGGQPQPMTRNQKTVPHQDLVLLKLDGSNIITWRKTMSTHLQTNYGSLGGFIENDALFVRAIPTVQMINAMYPGHAAAVLARLFESATIENMKAVTRDVEKYVEMFGLMLSCVSDEGLDKVTADGGYAGARGTNNPLLLFNIIRRVHSLQQNNIGVAESQYLAQERYNAIRQLPGMLLGDYRAAFEMSVSNLITVNVAVIPVAAAQARHFFMHLDKQQYGQYMAKTLNHERDNIGAFPPTLQAVVDGCRAYIPMMSNLVPASVVQPIAYGLTVEQSQRPCHNCGQCGHWARECTQPDRRDNRKDTENNRSTIEPKTKKDRSEKKKKGSKATTKSAHGVVIDNHDFDATYGNEYDCFVLNILDAGVTTMKHGNSRHKHPRAVALDSFANHTFGCNENLFVNIKEKTFSLNGVTGRTTGTKIGWLPCFGSAAITPNSGCNAIALHDAERYKVEYFQRDRYIVHVNDDLRLNFCYDAVDKSYVCIFTDSILNALALAEANNACVAIHAATCTENETQYSKSEVNSARQAREVMKRMGYPSDIGLITAITKGQIMGVPITPADVIRATAIYGKDVASLKGKTVNRGNTSAQTIMIPQSKQREQQCHADVFYWRGTAFLLFVLKPLGLLLVQWLPASRTSTMMREAVEKLVGKVKARGYAITSMTTDPEAALAKLDGLVDVPWDTIGSSRTHVEHAEREVRTIKERLRCIEHGVGFKCAIRFARWIVYSVVSSLNATRQNDEGSSPREAFTGLKTNFTRDFRIAFGDYVQAHIAPVPSNGPDGRTVAAIGLCGTGNSKGSVWLYDVRTEAAFQADRWTVLPMPDIVIERLNQLADIDEFAVAKKLPLKHKETVITKINKSRARFQPEQSVESIVRLPTRHVPPQAADAGSFDQEPTVVTDVTVPLMEDPIEINLSTPTELDQPSVILPPHSVVPELIEARDIRHDDVVPAYGSLMMDGIKRSQRLASRAVDPFDLRIHRLSVKKAFHKHGDDAKVAVTQELEQMFTKKVFKCVKRDGLRRDQKAKIIRSSMFLKEKFDASGKFVKLKARLVAGGDGQDRSIYGDTSSPTVSLESVMMIIAIASAEERDMESSDVVAAFLEPEMIDEVYMMLDTYLTALIIELYPELKEFVSNGMLVVRLLRALYGCIQSSKLWYNKLCGVLVENGYIQNPYDQCVFNKICLDGKQITVCFHVDDLLITSVSKTGIKELETYLLSKFTDVTFVRGPKHSYLSMNLQKTDDGSWTVDMHGFIDKCLDGKVIKVGATSPATEDLFITDESAILLEDEQKAQFHTDVARLLYLAKRGRMDILTAISHLCSRVKAPNVDDLRKLTRVHAYLMKTRELVLRYKSRCVVDVTAYIDASFGVHDDFSSRSGLVTVVAGAAVAACSAKQKLVTKDSTESELVSLTDGSTLVLWSREWVLSQGHKLGPTIIYQDNKSVLSLMDTGRTTKQRTKHLNVRYFYIRDRIQKNELRLDYLPTGSMIADLMTKPLLGKLLISLRTAMLGFGKK